MIYRTRKTRKVVIVVLFLLWLSNLICICPRVEQTARGKCTVTWRHLPGVLWYRCIIPKKNNKTVHNTQVQSRRKEGRTRLGRKKLLCMSQRVKLKRDLPIFRLLCSVQSESIKRAKSRFCRLLALRSCVTVCEATGRTRKGREKTLVDEEVVEEGAWKK